MEFTKLAKLFCIEQFVEYETPKVVTIKSKYIGVFHRVIQVVIILYIILWVFYANLGYQYIDQGATSGTTTKVKGVAYTNHPDIRIGERVWDSVDLVAIENNAFFITTNVLVTANQTQSICSEKDKRIASCTNDSDCLPAGKPYHLGNGVSTGKCNITSGTCIVKAWCPIENDTEPEGVQKGVLNITKDFTVFIKNHVYFPHYKKSRSNLIEGVDRDYISSCKHHPTTDKYCPIFRIGDLVSLAENDGNSNEFDDKYFDDESLKGAVISININWDCNFDFDDSLCKPSYTFHRLDNFKGSAIAPGYNYRYAHYFVDDGKRNRELYKVYGIHFIVVTEARARAFDMVEFLQNVGSGIGLLGVASIFCDFFIMHLHRKKEFFKRHIFHPIQTVQATSSENGTKLVTATSSENGVKFSDRKKEKEEDEDLNRKYFKFSAIRTF